MNQYASTDDTRTRILNAAEYLFAQNSYRGTSLRSITGRASVNLAAVNYHFGSKESLLREVISRRILPLNNERERRLQDIREMAEARGSKPDIRKVLLAFIEPTLRFRESEPHAANFVAFIGRSLSDPDDTVRQVFHSFVMPLFQLLHKTACQALPDLDKEDILWRLHFTLGALMHTMFICNQSDKCTPPMVQKEIDTETLLDMVIRYVSAGMKAK